MVSAGKSRHTSALSIISNEQDEIKGDWKIYRTSGLSKRYSMLLYLTSTSTNPGREFLWSAEVLRSTRASGLPLPLWKADPLEGAKTDVLGRMQVLNSGWAIVSGQLQVAKSLRIYYFWFESV